MIPAVHRPRHRTATFLLAAFSLVVSGCVTSRAIRNYQGDEAELQFRLVSNDMPEARIYWRESPPLAETMLTVRPPVSDCEAVSIYVNPTAASNNRLGDDVLSVAPADSEAGGEWQFLAEDPCAVLLLAGKSADSGFGGIVLRTAAGEFGRQRIDLARDRVRPEQESLPAYMWPFAAVMLPVYAGVAVVTFETLGAVPRRDRHFEHPVTISFDFPDGSRKETVIGEDEALALLKGPFYQDDVLFRADSYDSNFLRFWTRAALLKLELDFREEAVAAWNDEYETEFNTRALVSVDGIDGDWLIDPRNGSQATTSLYTRVENPRYIRCRVDGYPTEQLDRRRSGHKVSVADPLNVH